MVQTRTIGVLLVDDHAIVRTGFRRLLEDSPDIRVVGEAADGEEALKVYPEVSPDVVVLDVSMAEGMGGLEAAKRLISRDPSARILVLSAYDEEPYPTRLMQAGARGYLSKRCAPTELADAVRAIAQGEKYLSAEIAQELAIGRVMGQADVFGALSGREFEVFRLLAESKSVREIADCLCLSAKTIETHRANIMKKLEIGSTGALVHLAIRHGIVQP